MYALAGDMYPAAETSGYAVSYPAGRRAAAAAAVAAATGDKPAAVVWASSCDVAPRLNGRWCPGTLSGTPAGKVGG